MNGLNLRVEYNHTLYYHKGCQADVENNIRCEELNNLCRSQKKSRRRVCHSVTPRDLGAFRVLLAFDQSIIHDYNHHVLLLNQESSPLLTRKNSPVTHLMSKSLSLSGRIIPVRNFLIHKYIWLPCQWLRNRSADTIACTVCMPPPACSRMASNSLF